MNGPALALLLALAQAPAAPVPASLPATTAPTVSAALAPATSIPGMAVVPGRPNLLQLGIPAIAPATWERVDQLLEARSARLLDVSPSGDAVLVSTRLGQVAQLHVVEQPLGMRTQVTFGAEPVRTGAFQPGDPSVIWFLRDAGGAENFQVFRLDRRSGLPEMITDGRSRHEALVLSPDGRRVAWAGTGRNGRDTDVYLADTARPREARRVVEGEGTWHPLDFSPDGTRLLVRRYRSISDSDLLLVDLASGARRPLTPATGKGSVGAARFAADGRSVFLVTDREGEHGELYRLDLEPAGAAPRPLTRNIRWDVEALAVARDGSRVAVTVNADGTSRLYLLEPRTGKLEPGRLPTGVAGALLFPAKAPRTLFVGLGTPRVPGDVWQLDPRGGKLVRWTRSELGGRDPATLAEPALVRYPGSDGISIPAWLYRPAGPGRKPVVVMWHGGPESQERPTFNPLAQLLVDRGIAVLLPNVRGSAGYGKGYLAMDDGVLRERSLTDVGATLDFVAAQPDLDPARVAVYGGSYGGYLVLATAAFYPERIRGAVDVVGISSIPTFLRSTAPYRRDLRRAEYGDERDPAVLAVLERISPLNRAGDIRAALLVVQGKNDPRVPQGEAEQVVAAVRARGGDVWYLLALDEGHGFQKKENRDFQVAATVTFLERVLGGR